MNYNITRYIASIILIIGVFRMPYGYYKFVRISTFIVAAVFLYLSYTKKNELWMVLFGILLILFNPIYPMTFDKSTWSILDVVSTAVLLMSIKYIGVSEKKPVDSIASDS